MRSPRGGTPRSAANSRASRPRCRTRGPDADTQPHAGGSEPGAPPSREAQARALAKALILVSDRHPAWTRHDLLKHLALVMPPQTRQMGSEEAQELLLGLADEALSGRTGEVVSIEAPEWPPLPASLRRELDRRSIYTRPGTARYATTAQLSLEDKLLAHAQTQSAPRLSADRAARRLGADPALLDAKLRGRARNPREHDAPRGLRLDQAATVWQVLTSPRTVEIITGPRAAPARLASWPPPRGSGTALCSAPPRPRTPPTACAGRSPGCREYHPAVR